MGTTIRVIFHSPTFYEFSNPLFNSSTSSWTKLLIHPFIDSLILSIHALVYLCTRFPTYPLTNSSNIPLFYVPWILKPTDQFIYILMGPVTHLSIYSLIHSFYQSTHSCTSALPFLPTLSPIRVIFHSYTFHKFSDPLVNSFLILHGHSYSSIHSLIHSFHQSTHSCTSALPFLLTLSPIRVIFHSYTFHKFSDPLVNSCLLLHGHSYSSIHSLIHSFYQSTHSCTSALPFLLTLSPIRVIFHSYTFHKFSDPLVNSCLLLHGHSYSSIHSLIHSFYQSTHSYTSTCAFLLIRASFRVIFHSSTFHEFSNPLINSSSPSLDPVTHPSIHWCSYLPITLYLWIRSLKKKLQMVFLCAVCVCACVFIRNCFRYKVLPF